MKSLKLYKIDRDELPVMYIAARSHEQAAQMYITWEAAHELPGRTYSVELAAFDTFDLEQRRQLRMLLLTSTEGIARRDPDAGWMIDSDGWTSFDSDEMKSSGVRLFQMRDLTPIEAIVLAFDYDRASELFEQHLRAHGGDPDAVLYREVELQHLEELANDAVYEALELDREGLVTCDANGHWSFISSLGDPPA
jgi:hypothetical protein